LFHLDYSELEANLLGSSRIGGHYGTTIVDPDNFQKFVILAHRVLETYFCSFSLVDSKLELKREDLAWINFYSATYSHGIKGKPWRQIICNILMFIVSGREAV
jgi:hypothetical protein